jgi:hypothetical protein
MFYQYQGLASAGSRAPLNPASIPQVKDAEWLPAAIASASKWKDLAGQVGSNTAQIAGSGLQAGAQVGATGIRAGADIAIGAQDALSNALTLNARQSEFRPAGQSLLLSGLAGVAKAAGALLDDRQPFQLPEMPQLTAIPSARDFGLIPEADDNKAAKPAKKS